MDSGIASKSSPVSRLFFANALILARLNNYLASVLPIRKPVKTRTYSETRSELNARSY